MQINDSLEKTLILGKIEGRRRGWERIRWLDGITSMMDMSLSRLRSWWWTGKPGMLQSMGLQKVGQAWVTELNWKTSNYLKTCPTIFPGPLHPELPQGLLKVNSYSSMGFSLLRGRWQMSLSFSHWPCSCGQYVVDTNVNLWAKSCSPLTSAIKVLSVHGQAHQFTCYLCLLSCVIMLLWQPQLLQQRSYELWNLRHVLSGTL